MLFTDLVARAHAHNLQVHPYSYRDENKFLHFNFHEDPYAEFDYWINTIGVDGLFTDFTGSLCNFQEWTLPPSNTVGASKFLDKIAALISSYKGKIILTSRLLFGDLEGQMPKISDRRLVLSVIEQQMIIAFAIHEDEDLVEDLCNAYVLINNSRYLDNRVRSPRSTEFLLNCALNLNATEFQQNFRCDSQSFHRLVELLRPCPVFHNQSRCPQTEVTWQVCIALWRLGHNGNGAATAMQSMLFGFGVGTIVLFTGRVITALLQVGCTYILWPSTERRREISQLMEAEGFPGCVGFVDGTTIPLSEKPAVDGECYWDRKHRYSINMQIVCDVDIRIIAFSVGSPGSMHDAGLWRKSSQAVNPTDFFSNGEYVIGDSAYGVSSYLIPAFKSPAADIQINKEFNYVLAKSRVRNEHIIGILKGRWSCLREHRQQIKSARDVQAMIRVSTACVILHNMLANLGDSWEEMFADVDPVEVSVAENVEGTEVERAIAFREKVRTYAIQKGYMNGILPIGE